MACYCQVRSRRALRWESLPEQEYRSAVPPYYFLLHPVSTVLFIYTLLRSMALTLWNDGIVWRGTKYPLEELRKGMV